MGKFQDYFEIRNALSTMRKLAQRLTRWQRDASNVAEEMKGLSRPTASENFQYPESLQNLPANVRDLRQYIESVTPRLLHDKEALQEEVQPIYRAVVLLESILVGVRNVSSALSGIEQLLTALNEYGEHHELMLEEASSLPIPIRQAVRFASQVARIKLNPLLETLRAFQQFSTTDPLLNKSRHTRLLVALDPNWREVLRSDGPTFVDDDDYEEDDDEWDDDDDDEVEEEEYERRHPRLHRKPPRARLKSKKYQEDDDDEEEYDDEDDGSELNDDDEVELVRAHRKGLDEEEPDVPEDHIDEYDDEYDDEDDIEDYGDEEDDIECDEEPPSDETSNVYTSSPDDSPPKTRFNKKIRRKGGKGRF